jgi:hypothetical protein
MRQHHHHHHHHKAHKPQDYTPPPSYIRPTQAREPKRIATIQPISLIPKTTISTPPPATTRMRPMPTMPPLDPLHTQHNVQAYGIRRHTIAMTPPYHKTHIRTRRAPHHEDLPHLQPPRHNPTHAHRQNLLLRHHPNARPTNPPQQPPQAPTARHQVQAQTTTRPAPLNVTTPGPPPLRPWPQQRQCRRHPVTSTTSRTTPSWTPLPPLRRPRQLRLQTPALIPTWLPTLLYSADEARQDRHHFHDTVPGRTTQPTPPWRLHPRCLTTTAPPKTQCLGPCRYKRPYLGQPSVPTTLLVALHPHAQ